MSQGELMVLFGPPAVGKMTVGRAVCQRTDFKLFLNHHTIEPLAGIFGMDSRPFRAVTGEFRRLVVEEAAAANVASMLTLVWNLGAVEDARWVTDLVSPYADAGLSVSFVELAANLEPGCIETVAKTGFRPSHRSETSPGPSSTCASERAGQ